MSYRAPDVSRRRGEVIAPISALRGAIAMFVSCCTCAKRGGAAMPAARTITRLVPPQVWRSLAG